MMVQDPGFSGSPGRPVPDRRTRWCGSAWSHWSRWSLVLWGALALFPWAGRSQTLEIHDAVRGYAALRDTTVTLTGRAELRITGTGDPLSGSVIHLNSPDAWLRMTELRPSDVASAFLDRVRVDGAAAVLGQNVRVAQFGQGAVVIPQGAEFKPLEVFAGRNFTGRSRRLQSYVAYDDDNSGSVAGAIGSFKLRRGYMATLAQMEDGTGASRCYVAQDGDLEVGRLPVELEDSVRFVRVFPWRWVTKKGIAGNIESGLDVQWLYNWNLDRNSPLDWEYVPIRQTRWWPSLDQNWRVRGATHLLGYNEPDRPDQANMNVGDAISSWPDLVWTGLRLGAPAVSDGGLGWLYDFMEQAEAAGLRVDFVPVHYYRCFGNPGDPNGTATQFYNFLKGIHDVVQRPLWVTEWNNGANWTGCADPSPAQQAAAIEAILDMLDSTPFVERYALYNWVEDERRVKWDDGSLTGAGVVYRDQRSPLAYRQEMPDAGTAASAIFTFDGDAHDAVGNGHAAMRVGAAGFVPGRHSQAVALNGVTDYLQVSPRLGENTDWSFAGWIYWNGGGDWQRIFDFGADTGHFLFLTPRSGDDTLRFGIRDGGAEQRLNAAPLPVGVWTHVAVTLSGDTGKLFVNGALADVNSGMTLDPEDVGARFNYLGKSQWPNDPLFAGRFDDFRFLNFALPDSRVAAIASTPPPRFDSSVLWKADAAAMEPYAGTLAGDASGTGTVRYAKVDGPGWLAVRPDGSLLGTPSLEDGGLNRFLVRAADVNGSAQTATLLIHVTSLSIRVATGEDDAEQSVTGDVDLASSDLELVRDSAGGAGDQIIGLRFNGLPIPRGAVVTEATLQFTADESQSVSTELAIAVEAADDAAPFNATGNNLGARTLSQLRVMWAPSAWTAGEAGAAQQTPNIAGLVQEVVGRSGWNPGNALVFLIFGEGHRTADSSDKSGGSPPRLLLSYTPPTPMLTAASAVGGGADDAEESAGGVVDLSSTDLEMVDDTGALELNQTIGVRFEHVAVPAGAWIAGAHLQFTADEAQDEATQLVIRAEDVGDAAVFGNAASDLTGRNMTGAFVNWNPPPWRNVRERGSLQRTPDLSALVREVVARSDWEPGNAMAFFVSGAGHRTAESADKTGGFPATLSIDYWPELPRGTFWRWGELHPNGRVVSDDFDLDGYDSLFEYALGLDPDVADLAAVTVTADESRFYLSYSRPVDVTDVTYQVEWVNRLGFSWNSAGLTQEILSDDGVWRRIRVAVPRGPFGQRFVRLRVIH